MRSVDAMTGSPGKRPWQRNVRGGVVTGLIYATGYSIFVAVIYLLGGARGAEKSGLTIFSVLLTYYAAGVLGGATVGALLPLTRWRVGRAAVSVAAAFVVFFCIGITSSGPFWRWTSREWEPVIVLGLIFGVTISFLWARLSVD